MQTLILLYCNTEDTTAIFVPKNSESASVDLQVEKES